MAGYNLKSDTRKEIYKKYPACQNQYCKHKITEQNKLTIDHVVPRVIYNVYGFSDWINEIDNLTVLCRQCNYQKGNQLDYRLPQTYTLVKKLHDRWFALHKKRHRNVYTFRTLPVKHDNTVYHFVNNSEYLKSIYSKQKGVHNSARPPKTTV